MALARSLNPELVLCGPCRGDPRHATRIQAQYADEDDGGILVREVCASVDCPELQVRGHLCTVHALAYELAWQHQIPTRACHGCHRGLLELYREGSSRGDVWCILANRGDFTCLRGVERRWLDREDVECVYQHPQRINDKAKKRRPTRRRPRRSVNLQQLRHKERRRALEWSLGNVPMEPQFLWKENKRREEAATAAKSREAAKADPSRATNGLKDPPARRFARPDPLTVFCTAPQCPRFAKTGDRCLFHARQSALSALAFGPGATAASAAARLILQEERG